MKDKDKNKDTDDKEKSDESTLNSEDLYYDRQVPRAHSLSLNMLNFHNQVIKKSLYMQCKGQTLLELACGKAGDLNKIREAGFNFILGLDITKDNIVNSSDGAYARLLTQLRSTPQASHYLDAVFVVADAKEPIKTGAAALDPESKSLLKAVYGPRSRQDYLTRVTGRIKGGFDLVSCQFAIHYFFEREEHLNGLFKNVADNLKTGGNFICTFMDGNAVHSELVSNDGKIEGITNETVIWAILKAYDTFDSSDAYGKKIQVYLEMTRQLIPEFLVNFDTLVQKAKEYGLELAESATFQEKYVRSQSQSQQYGSQNRGHSGRGHSGRWNNDRMDAVQQRFSFLNRYAIFKKT